MFNKIFTNIIIVLLSLGIIIAPLITDRSDLPKGWELPKVLFVQIICAVLIVIILINKLYSKKLKFSKSFFIYILLISILILSTIFAQYKDTAIYGNSFRDAGLITYFLLITLSFLISNYFNKENLNIVLGSFVISGIIQAAIGITQTLELYNNAPEKIKDGLWIFGTYGQTNFYFAHLLISILVSIYFLSFKNKKLKLISILSLIILSLGIIFTHSYWGYISLSFGLVLISIYLFLPKKYFILTTLLFTLTILILSIVFKDKFLEIYPEYFFRLSIWEEIINIYTSNYINFSIGSGLDTLGEILSRTSTFQGIYVDRAHNIFLEIFASGGIVLLSMFITFIGFVIKKSGLKVNDKKVIFLLIIFLSLIFKNLIHTTGSIVNIFQLFIVVSILMSLINKNTDTNYLRKSE